MPTGTNYQSYQQEAIFMSPSPMYYHYGQQPDGSGRSNSGADHQYY